MVVAACLTARFSWSAELVASPTMEQRRHHGCKLKSLAEAARQNPARVFAILAGIAFVCLLGTFVAQVVLAIVCGVRALLDLPLQCHCNAHLRGEIIATVAADQSPASSGQVTRGKLAWGTACQQHPCGAQGYYLGSMQAG